MLRNCKEINGMKKKVCKQEECWTVLSQYNPGQYCFLHRKLRHASQPYKALSRFPQGSKQDGSVEDI